MSELVAIRPPQRGLPKSDKPHLRDLPLRQLQAWMAENLGGAPFRAAQIFEWLHRHRVVAHDEMSNLAKADRERLALTSRIEPLGVDVVRIAGDGTRKLRLRTIDGQAIEAVLIPNEGRGFTLCISSMVGCSLSCQFCATQTLGFIRNLSTWEIVDQVYRAQDLLVAHAEQARLAWVPRIVNLVLMGMGEPLHNFVQVKRALEILTDPRGAAIAGRRITVSTAGLVPAIERFAREGVADEIGLAVSLNATTDAVRDRIMPINRRWNIEQLLAAVRHIPQPKRRLLTFEYVLLADINDSDDDAKRLVGLLEGVDAQVNAIPFNPHAGSSYRRPSAERIARFVSIARRLGQPVHLRTPRGDDIGAACGQLALEEATPCT